MVLVINSSTKLTQTISKRQQNTKQRIHHYCAMILMLEESVSNITCTLQELGWANNTVMVVLSDNGGDARNIPGTNAPLRGSKNTLWNGGVRANCFIHSELIPLRARGAKFEGLSHITDWFPTLMHVATNNTWSGTRINGEPVDGVDLWDTLISCQRGETATNYYSPRTSALVNWDEENYEGMVSKDYRESPEPRQLRGPPNVFLLEHAR